MSCAYTCVYELGCMSSELKFRYDSSLFLNDSVFEIFFFRKRGTVDLYVNVNLNLYNCWVVAVAEIEVLNERQ